MPDVFMRMDAVDQGWHLGCRAHWVCTALLVSQTGFVQGSRHCGLYHHNRPIGSHLLGRAAFRADTKVFQATTEDDEVAGFVIRIDPDQTQFSDIDIGQGASQTAS